VKHPFESPSRRLVRGVQRSLIQVLSIHDIEKLSNAGVTARYSLANAYTSFNMSFPFVKLEVDQLIRAREPMDRALEKMILASGKLVGADVRSDIVTDDEKRRAVEKLQTEAAAFRAVLAQLSPIHSTVHQVTTLVAIPPAEYRRMSPAARKRRDVFNDRLVAAREEVFEELTSISLEYFVKAVSETVADTKYRSYVSSHQLKEIDQELSTLLDEIVVSGLVLFVTS